MFHGLKISLRQHKILFCMTEISLFRTIQSFFEALRWSVRDLFTHARVFARAIHSEKFALVKIFYNACE
ncbi:MAG: hypothetical protein JWN90_488 [Parcubacteria group bacterium]|nr:hypothetical protein [Parcubacteria group bacterium]